MSTGKQKNEAYLRLRIKVTIYVRACVVDILLLLKRNLDEKFCPLAREEISIALSN